MQYTVNSILNYIESDKTSYAILLNGKWGSGKTYFWKNVLKKEIKDRGKKIIYVSLYGVSSKEEIDKKIVLGKSEFVEKISDSKVGGITEIGKAVFGVVKKFDITGLSEELSNINYKDFFNYSDTVLCFDDLERVNMSIDEVLGYINNFVEHDGIKVIIIGNEDEIADKLNDKNRELKMLTTYFYLEKTEDGNHINAKTQGEKVLESDLIKNTLNDLFHKQNEYKRIKEKLIGKTLTIQLDERSLIEDIINHTSEIKLHSFLEHNMEIIETTFKESEIKNIRILTQGLEDFELIYQNCIECGYELDIMLQSILKFVLAASFEIKANIPRNEELDGINSHDDFTTEISLSGIVSGKAKCFPAEFQKKYYNGQGTLYKRKFFKFAEVLIRKGIFNKQLFKVEMDSFQLELDGMKSTDPHIEFIKDGYWNLSDADFEVVEQSTYNKLKNGELHFTWYFRAYRMYEFFVENKMVTKNILDIKQELMEGLEKSGERGEYIEYTNSMFYMEENLNTEHLNDFKNKIIQVNNGLRLEKEKENVPKLLELMRTDSYNFYIKMREQYLHKPFFVYCNPEELYESIINLSAEAINTVRAIVKQRIQFVDDNFNSNLQKDLPNLKIIKSRLNVEINSRTKTPRLVLLEYLIKDIKEFEKKVNSLNAINESIL